MSVVDVGRQAHCRHELRLYASQVHRVREEVQYKPVSTKNPSVSLSACCLSYNLMILKMNIFWMRKVISRRWPNNSLVCRLIEQCTSKDISQRPSFAAVIEILEEVILLLKKAGCAVC